MSSYNQILAKKVSGKRKSDPNLTWQGLAIQATVDGVNYSGVIFPVREATISEQDAVKFE